MSHPAGFSQSRAIASLATLYIFRMLGLFMVLPVLALAQGDYMGSNVFLMGVALGVYGLTQAVLQIPFGILSDRFGRKPLIFLGLILFAIGSVVAAVADTVWGLIIGRALQGAGAIAGVIMAMVGDVTTPENRTKAMASIGAAIGVAFAIALIIGPLISSLVLFDVSGVRLLFWASVVLSIVGVVITLWFVPSVSSVQAKVAQLSFKHLGTVLHNRQCLLLYGGVFVLHYVLMCVFVVMPLLLSGASLKGSEHSWVYLGVMLLSFVVMVPLMIIGERRQQVKVLLCLAIGLLAMAIGVIWLAPSVLTTLIIGLGLFFIAFNYLEANLPSLLTKVLPAANKGAGSGVFATCQFLGAALGGIAGGAIYSTWGLGFCLLSAVVLLGVWLSMARFMIIPQPKA